MSKPRDTPPPASPALLAFWRQIRQLSERLDTLDQQLAERLDALETGG